MYLFDQIQNLDVSLLYGLRSYQSPVLVELAGAVSILAWKGWLWWGVIISSWFKGNRRFSVQLALAIGISTVAGLPLKSIIARPRPDLWQSITTHTPMPELLSTQHSFPSGHTLLAAAFAFVVIMYYRDYRAWLAAAFVVLVGLARVYEAMHWPSDVVGSAILGFGAAYAAGLVMKLPAVDRILMKLGVGQPAKASQKSQKSRIAI